MSGRVNNVRFTRNTFYCQKNNGRGLIVPFESTICERTCGGNKKNSAGVRKEYRILVKYLLH